MLRTIFKGFLRVALPASTYTVWQAIYNRRLIEGVEEKLGLSDINERFERENGRQVRNGPFRGMEYTPLTTRRHVTQRLIGAYECELHPIVQKVIDRGYRRIVDIGCAEGYYAVGLARAIAGCTVEAFDTDPWARKACAALARQNGVAERVIVRGYCSKAWLLENAPPDGLIVSDCEGFERVLFNAETAGRFARTDLLVEIHDRPPAPDDPMVIAFAATHDFQVIPGEGHEASRYPELNGWPDRDRQLAVSDMRTPGLGWLFFESRHVR